MGNKSDLEEKRKVNFDEAIRLGKKLNLSAVFEASAKSNDSIDDVFFRCIVNCADSQPKNKLEITNTRSSIFSHEKLSHSYSYI